VKQVKNRNVTAGVQITRNFDGVGNLLNITQDGVTTSYSRFGDGSVSRALFPRNLAHNYSNYKRGIPQTENQPEGINIYRTVSDSGNVLSETNGRGNMTSYSHDGLNRVTRINPPQGNATAISHAQASRTASRGGLTESTQYDGFGRPTSVTLGGITRTYRHDALGRTAFVSNPGATIGTGYQYDILDRVTAVTNADATSRAITFGAAHRLSIPKPGPQSTDATTPTTWCPARSEHRARQPSATTAKIV
jgi:YD repeat-containing protein